MLAKIDQYVAYTGEDWRDDNNNEDDNLPAISRSDKMLQNLDLINEDDCPELEDVEVPKVLGDTVEAAMGAVFVDSGFDLGVVWGCFRRLFPDMEDVIKRNPRNVVARDAIQ